MSTMTVRLRNIPDTEAAVGWAGGHTIVVDRPDGKAGGRGLGFNGGQLLGLAIGGCFCNDLRYVAHEIGIVLAAIEVDVTVSFDGVPLLATAAEMRVKVTPQVAGTDVAPLIARAKATSTVSNSLARGIRIDTVAVS
jgi:organic hydroperoxide reductase OsmC/OhrA